MELESPKSLITLNHNRRIRGEPCTTQKHRDSLNNSTRLSSTSAFVHTFESEVNTDRGLVVVGENTMDVALDDGGLSGTDISVDQNLE